jgi:hypothetical protein
MLYLYSAFILNLCKISVIRCLNIVPHDSHVAALVAAATVAANDGASKVVRGIAVKHLVRAYGSDDITSNAASSINLAVPGIDGSYASEQSAASSSIVTGKRLHSGAVASPRNPITRKHSLRTAITLANNITMPLIGFGTWGLQSSECEAIVYDAIRLGYRFIDTAQAYGNENAVRFRVLTFLLLPAFFINHAILKLMLF